MQEDNYTRKKITMSIVAITFLILALIGITYAYFIAKVKGNQSDKSVEVTSGKLELTYGDGNGVIEVEGIEPGDDIKEKTFTVTNTGDGKINRYDVVLENLVNELKNYDDFIYELSCVSTSGTCYGSKGVFPINNNIIVNNSIDVDETQTYTLKLYFIDTLTDQSVDMKKNITAKINIREPEFTYTKFNIYGNTVLENNKEKNSLGVLVEDENNLRYGMYKINIVSTNKNTNEEIIYPIYLKEPLRCFNNTCDYIDYINGKIVRKIKNDNGTLSILDSDINEGVQLIDYYYLINNNIKITDNILESSKVDIEIQTKK